MRFVGIDPSTKTGLVIIDKQGQIIVAKEIRSKLKEDPARFSDICNQIMEQLAPSDTVAIEGFSYGSQGKGVSTQYGLGWLIRYFLWNKYFDFIEIPPTSVKKFATGKGNTKKDEMVLPIFKKWGFESNSDNIRDAFVLAKIVQAIHEHINLTEYQKDALAKVKL